MVSSPILSMGFAEFLSAILRSVRFTGVTSMLARIDPNVYDGLTLRFHSDDLCDDVIDERSVVCTTLHGLVEMVPSDHRHYTVVILVQRSLRGV